MLRNSIILLGAIVIGAGITYLLDYTAVLPPKAVQDVKVTESAPSKDQHNKTVPDFIFTPLGSAKPVNIADLRGKVIVLNFWASWCAPCVKEFPIFLQMATEYKDRVVFVALSSDHDQEAMMRFLDSLRRDHKQEMALDNVMIAMDENSAITRGTFQTFRLPETIVIDRAGVMREKLIGADWNYTDIKAFIEKFDRD